MSHRRHLLADRDGQTLPMNVSGDNCGAPCRTDVANTLGCVFSGRTRDDASPRSHAPEAGVGGESMKHSLPVFLRKNPLTFDLSADVSILRGGTGDPE